MQELLTAVWLEALYQVFHSERGTKLNRRTWFHAVARIMPQLERMRVYN